MALRYPQAMPHRFGDTHHAVHGADGPQPMRRVRPLAAMGLQQLAVATTAQQGIEPLIFGLTQP